ncbi:MAG TPA: triose-phosphate isomerase [Terriglobales bacterium]|jgi:triosephosphate isomerase
MPKSTRRKIMAANWKMHKTVAETREFFTALTLPAARACAVVVAPPYLAIPAAVEAARGRDIAIAGQNLYWESKGAFTGEISGPMLAAAGCGYVIIGHSERRQYFGETDATVNRRLVAALAANLTPIVCVGETLPEREAGQVEAVLRRQFTGGFEGLDATAAQRCVLAYEPVWAIGTGKVATPEQAQQAQAFLRACVQERFGAELAMGMSILYGGSVKPDNVKSLMAQPDVDGGLVGGASLDPVAFAALVAGF